ncbi:MAG: YbjQ family protein [Alloprevotella sp.]
MYLTTTPNLEGHSIREYRGIVTAETIIGANFLKDFMAGLRDFFGGRSHTYENTFAEARETALAELTQKALQLGANAIVGLRLDYETVGDANSMLMVIASGTAVCID